MRIVGVAGGIGSGKSELSRALARSTGGVILSFGDYIRTEAERRGVEPTRESLQQLGGHLINELGAPELVRRVLSEHSQAEVLIVDGVRHLDVNEALKKMASQYLLVFVDVDDETRRRRLVEREGHEVDLAAIDQHSTEREVPELRKHAAAVVDGGDNAAAAKLVRELLG